MKNRKNINVENLEKIFNELKAMDYNSNHYEKAYKLIDDFVANIKGKVDDVIWQELQIYQQKLELYKKNYSIGYKNALLLMEDFIRQVK